jgi:hypothetical protein
LEECPGSAADELLEEILEDIGFKWMGEVLAGVEDVCLCFF